MFTKILVALDHSRADQALLPHVKDLARLTKAQILLFHVSTGWQAQWQMSLNLADSEEIRDDREYLENIAKELGDAGFQVDSRHAAGTPAAEILRTARQENCDLIAMTTHGHRLLSDLIFGETIETVRQEYEIPLFLVRGGH